jgi:hypothetical protein
MAARLVPELAVTRRVAVGGVFVALLAFLYLLAHVLYAPSPPGSAAPLQWVEPAATGGGEPH